MVVKRISHRRYTANLRASVRAYERHNDCTTEAKMRDVRNGHSEQTAGVSRWFFNYRALKRLEALNGRTTGEGERQ